MILYNIAKTNIWRVDFHYLKLNDAQRNKNHENKWNRKAWNVPKNRKRKHPLSKHQFKKKSTKFTPSAFKHHHHGGEGRKIKIIFFRIFFHHEQWKNAIGFTRMEVTFTYIIIPAKNLTMVIMRPCHPPETMNWNEKLKSRVGVYITHTYTHTHRTIFLFQKKSTMKNKTRNKTKLHIEIHYTLRFFFNKFSDRSTAFMDALKKFSN